MTSFYKEKGFVQCSDYNKSELLNNYSPNCSDCSIEHFELLNKRKILLNKMKNKQSFRVAKGKSKWVDYETFDGNYNLREILKDEIVIEFDTTNQDIAWEAINFTAINLLNAGYEFEIWDHEGKSPHLHIHDLPISHLDPEKRRTFKKLFIRKYVPLEYLKWVDYSLTGIHLIALEWCNHWKGCYYVKRLIHRFERRFSRT